MPLPFIPLAYPVLHSSGLWIASAAGSYVGGTISSTWIGAFVLGNKGLLAGTGLISAAGLAGASATVLGGIGTGLTAIGLGGVAQFFGIAPAATFLGLTPVGWSIAGTGAVLASTVGYYFTRKFMRRLNEEREKGGLEPITVLEIIREVRQLEAQSMSSILEKLQAERDDVSLSSDGKEAVIAGQLLSVGKLKYAVNEDGSEEIVYVTKTGRRKRVLLVKTGTASKSDVRGA